MTSESPRHRPITGEHWKNSKVAKADAVQWVNQRNLRIVLEHVTAELLQAQPDDPLEFMIDVLQRGQEESEQMSRERPATTDSSRPATAVGQGKEDEVLEAMQAERDKWRNLYDEEAAKAAGLEKEIAELEAKLAAPPPPDED